MNQTILNILPLKTERLILRITTLNDVNLLLKMDKQKQTQKFLGGIKNKTKEERMIFLKNKIDKSKEGNIYPITIELKERLPIGFIDLKIDPQTKIGQISYIFDSDYWKKGYCLEACQKLIELSFTKLKLTKILASTLKENTNSKRLLEKLGFKLKESRTKLSSIDKIEQYNCFLEYELIKK